MKNLVAITCMASLSLFSSLSYAESTAYIGIAAGATSTTVDDIDEDTSSKIFVGFKPDDHIILEASLFTTGEAGLEAPSGASSVLQSAFDDITIESSGINIAALYAFPKKIIGMTTAVGAGAYIFETEIQDPSFAGLGDSEEDSFGASLHGRAEYVAFKALALRLDLDVFIGVKFRDENKTVSSLTAGLAYMF